MPHDWKEQLWFVEQVHHHVQLAYWKQDDTFDKAKALDERDLPTMRELSQLMYHTRNLLEAILLAATQEPPKVKPEGYGHAKNEH